MFYISLANTINDEKHFKKMGVAIWLYIYFLDKVTSIDEFGNGLVTFGNVIKLEEIKHIPYRTVRRYHDVLQKEGYIISDRASKGVRIKITKCKKIFGNREDKNVLSKKSDRTKVDAQKPSDRTKIVSDRTKVDAILYNKPIQATSLQDNIPAIAGLQDKKKKMKTYDENKSYEEEAIDLDSGELVIKEKPKPKRKENEMMLLISWAEEQKRSKFANYGKQMKYIKMMTDSGKTYEDIAERWEKMAKDAFWKKNGYDFKNVCDDFDKK